MTDSMADVDRLLIEDGARWRAGQPAPPDPDPALLTGPRRPRWQPLAAAAAAAAVVAAGAVTVAVVRHRSDPAPPPADTGSQVVHDGDRVAGQGWVIAEPGKPVRMCTTRRTLPTIDRNTGREVPDFPGTFDPSLRVYTEHSGYCSNGLTLVGVDLHRLAFRVVRGGAVSGQVDVTGVYRDGTVTVTEQRVPGVLTRYIPMSLPADCREPAGGWPRAAASTVKDELESVRRYVEARPAVFGGVTQRVVGRGAAMQGVTLVTTTGDVAEATRAVRARWTGAACVRAVPHSRAQALAAWTVIHRALTNPRTAARYGLIGGQQTADAGGDPRARMTVLVWNGAAESLRRSAGPDVVDVDPLLRKVG